jgi:hypothetical protein
MATLYLRSALLGVALTACASADEAVVAEQQAVSVKADPSVQDWGAADHLTITAALLDFAPARREGALLPKPVGTLLAAWGGYPLEGCVGGTPWLDKDRDGIPARWRGDLDCFVLRTNGVSVRVLGSVTVVDNDDFAAMSGYEVAFQKLHVGTFMNRTPVIARTLDGTASVDARGAATRPPARVTLEAALQLSVERAFLTTGASKEAYETKITGAYTADLDVALAAPLSRGTLELHQTSDVATAVQKAMGIQAKAMLHYNAACRKVGVETIPFDSGEYIAEAGGTLVRVQFRDCGDWTVTATPLDQPM